MTTQEIKGKRISQLKVENNTDKLRKILNALLEGKYTDKT